MNTIPKLKRLLREAQRMWQADNSNSDLAGLPGYMPGVIKGLKEAMQILETQQRQQVRKKLVERRLMSRWHAVTLYRACTQAYGRLKYSDRQGAIRALKRALEKTKPEKEV